MMTFSARCWGILNYTYNPFSYIFILQRNQDLFYTETSTSSSSIGNASLTLHLAFAGSIRTRLRCSNQST